MVVGKWAGPAWVFSAVVCHRRNSSCKVWISSSAFFNSLFNLVASCVGRQTNTSSSMATAVMGMPQRTRMSVLKAIAATSFDRGHRPHPLFMGSAAKSAAIMRREGKGNVPTTLAPNCCRYRCATSHACHGMVLIVDGPHELITSRSCESPKHAFSPSAQPKSSLV